MNSETARRRGACELRGLLTAWSRALLRSVRVTECLSGDGSRYRPDTGSYTAAIRCSTGDDVRVTLVTCVFAVQPCVMRRRGVAAARVRFRVR